MKLSFILLLITFLQVSADGLSQTVSISGNHLSLKKVLKDIQKQTGYDYILTKEQLSESKHLNLNLDRVSVEEALKSVFAGQPLDFRLLNKTIVVNRRKMETKIPVPENILEEETPQIRITGKVTDANSGGPLAGVTIRVKGTTTGTVTDGSGNFNIEADDEAILEVTFVGYTAKEVPVAGKTTVNISLEASATGLDQLVVVGFGTQKKGDLTSSISSVSASDLKDKSLSNFAAAMAGQTPGVNIGNSNAEPGGGNRIQIRGINSINASNDPLIVIDGFPLSNNFSKTTNPLNSLSPQDIESIQVLKDATATAIYGTQGANGVIIITTKSGKVGKPRFDINISSGFSNMINKFDVLEREDFLKYIDDARAQAYIVEDPNFGTDDPNAPLWKWTDAPSLRIENWKNFSSNKDAMKDPSSLFDRWITVSDTIYNSPYNTHWQDVISRQGKVNNVELSVSGGSDNFRYRISGNYFDQVGIMKSSDYDRYSFRANLELDANKFITIGLRLNPTLEKFNKLPNIDGATEASPIYSSATMPPIWSPVDEDGRPIFYGNILLNPWDWNFSFFVNPLSALLEKSKTDRVRNLTTIYGELHLTDNLKFRAELNSEYTSTEDFNFIPNALPTTSQLFSRSQGTDQTNTLNFWNFQSYLTYNKSFNNHSLTGMIGFSAQESRFKGNFIHKYDYPLDNISTLNQAITVLNAQDDARTSKSSEALEGAFGRVNYNFKERYYLTGSIRRDGSSKFGSGRRWGVFPSASGAWRLSGENFFNGKVTDFISDLKIRGGWGRIGNEGIGNYLSLENLAASSYVIGRGSDVLAAYNVSNLGNKKLSWETTEEVDLGIDLGLLNNRILLTIDYFNRTTKDLLFNVPLPTITGFGSFTSNVGSLRNKGLEYSVTSNNFTGKFGWTTKANISYFRNSIQDLGADHRPLVSGNSYTAEGKSISSIWGPSFLGPYEDWEDVKTSPIKNANQATWRFRSAPGTPKLADVNGDGVIDASDNTIIGNPNPNFIWGLTNEFNYRNFDLTIVIRGVQGRQVLMAQDGTFFGRGDGRHNTIKDYYENYWRPDRTNAKYAAPTRKEYDGTDISGSLVYDASFADFENVTLGYTFTNTILKKIHLSGLRVYVSGSHLFYLTKFPGFNPEANYGGNDALQNGVNRGAYPIARTINFGLNISL